MNKFQRKNPEKRFWAYVDKQSNGCWLWTGYLTNGYGRFKIHGERIMAHRWIYEKEKGAIPEGYEIDHICRQRNCVNPEHLEIVTPRENMARSLNQGARALREDKCIHGHDYTVENTYYSPRGYRRCRACMRIKDRKRAGTLKRRLSHRLASRRYRINQEIRR